MGHAEPSVTVVLPTADRCLFLRQALESVASQCAREEIAEVLVSENGGCRESKAVALDYAEQLPVRWVFHEQRMTPQQHGVWLAQQVRTTFVAPLADDDMWDKYHLLEALARLRADPSLVAYFGQAVCVHNQSCQVQGRFSTTWPSILAEDGNSLVDLLCWEQAQVAVNCLTSTPLNIWANVVHAPAHLAALLESAVDPEFGHYPSNDVLYLWRLSCAGGLGVGRHVSLFYRQHASSDIQTCLRDNYAETMRGDLLIRREIVRQAAACGIDAIALWQQHYARAMELGREASVAFLSPEHRQWLLPEPPESQGNDDRPDGRQQADPSPTPATPCDRPVPGTPGPGAAEAVDSVAAPLPDRSDRLRLPLLRHVAKQLLPPIITAALVRLRRRLRSP